MNAPEADALNKLADYFKQCADSLVSWREHELRGPKIVNAEIATWNAAADIARSYAERRAQP
jgi:hypothetical protein